MSKTMENFSEQKIGEVEQFGQVHLEDGSTTNSVASMKYTENGILLDPQPSDDPHDPLNFSAWEKGCLLVALAYWAFLGTTNLIVVVSQPAAALIAQPLTTFMWQSPSFFMISKYYDVTLDSVAYTVNGPLVAYGAGVRHCSSNVVTKCNAKSRYSA